MLLATKDSLLYCIGRLLWRAKWLDSEVLWSRQKFSSNIFLLPKCLFDFLTKVYVKESLIGAVFAELELCGTLHCIVLQSKNLMATRGCVCRGRSLKSGLIHSYYIIDMIGGEPPSRKTILWPPLKFGDRAKPCLKHLINSRDMIARPYTRWSRPMPMLLATKDSLLYCIGRLLWRNGSTRGVTHIFFQ